MRKTTFVSSLLHTSHDSLKHIDGHIIPRQNDNDIANNMWENMSLNQLQQGPNATKLSVNQIRNIEAHCICTAQLIMIVYMYIKLYGQSGQEGDQNVAPIDGTT